jgi:hypothetical protein
MGNVETYKKTHRPKPLKEDAAAKGKPHQGVFIPKHPEKVVGGEIITRSSWEMSFARWCDDNPSVIEWGCEVCAIQYRNPGAVNLDACRQSGASPLDPLNWPVHEYYPDFYVALRDEEDEDGTKVQKLLIEIKPHYQTERPVPPPPGAKLQEQKKFNEAAKTYLQNIKKWEAAIAWAKNHGMEFKVFTENTLQKMGII